MSPAAWAEAVRDALAAAEAEASRARCDCGDAWCPNDCGETEDDDAA